MGEKLQLSNALTVETRFKEFAAEIHNLDNIQQIYHFVGLNHRAQLPKLTPRSKLQIPRNSVHAKFPNCLKFSRVSLSGISW
jgi:hypothetical protein